VKLPSSFDLQLHRRFSKLKESYPPQVWLLFWGTLVSTSGMSMIWPFLVVYIGQELALPLTTVTSLIALNSIMSLLTSFLAGSITDRIGRKWAMVISLSVNGLAFLGMVPAAAYWHYAVLMAVRGAFQPLYRVGADAMLADLVPAEQRADAYALNRLGKNVGVAVGPALGGVFVSISYGIAFALAAGATIFFSVLIALFALETLPENTGKTHTASLPTLLDGYRLIFQDRVFITFIGGFILRQISASMLWVLLAAYAKENYGLGENLYGLIPTTNALMVVFLQLWVTRKTQRFPPLKVMFWGTLLYGIGVGSVALGSGFWGFWISMIILTWGELMVIPTASSYTANRAPEAMRGRYMSLLALTWGAGSMIGPVLGGFLNDQFHPVTIWLGGGAAGLLGALVYLYLLKIRPGEEPSP
jgi:MFS family permease